MGHVFYRRGVDDYFAVLTDGVGLDHNPITIFSPKTRPPPAPPSKEGSADALNPPLLKGELEGVFFIMQLPLHIGAKHTDAGSCTRIAF